MKMYILQTVESDDNGICSIIWHKHLFLFQDDAFREAQKKGPNTCVLELSQSNSWTPEEIKDFQPYPGG